jgi:hypothetical protein
MKRLLFALTLVLTIAQAACTPRTETVSSTVVVTTTATVIGTTTLLRQSIPTLTDSPPTPGLAGDEAVPTPGGVAYRASIHQEGVPDKWPPIVEKEVKLAGSLGEATVSYRQRITTKVGETRNNIIRISGLNRPPDMGGTLDLYVVGLPAELTVSQVGNGSWGMPGIIESMLVINIPPGIPPIDYDFQIGLVIKGVDYGTIPCTVAVGFTVG